MLPYFRPALAALAALILSTVPAASQDAPSAADMVKMIQERLADRPDDPGLHYYLAVYQAAAGDTAGCIATLGRVGELGVGFLPARGLPFDAIWDDPGFQKARKALEDKLPRVTKAKELFRLEKNLIPEGISWDPASRRFFVGSIAERKIVQVDSKEKVSDFSQPGELGNVLGLAIDASRRRLYAVSTNGFTEAGTTNPDNRVVSYDLETGKLIRSIPIEGAGQLNDVAVSGDGAVYASDTRSGAVFRIFEDGRRDTVVALGTLRGANGLALSADGSALYVAHSTGVAHINLADGNLTGRIAVPAREAIGAIDGLYTDGADLIGIQNVTNPGRVIRMKLAAGGRSVEEVETLLSHHHEAIEEPTTGVVSGRTFVFLARTHVSRFTPQGTITSPETLKPPVVLSLDLDRGRKENTR